MGVCSSSKQEEWAQVDEQYGAASLIVATLRSITPFAAIRMLRSLGNCYFLRGNNLVVKYPERDDENCCNIDRTTRK